MYLYLIGHSRYFIKPDPDLGDLAGLISFHIFYANSFHFLPVLDFGFLLDESLF